jgi:hypothetical protein
MRIWYTRNLTDNREKLQAMELFKDTHLVKLELLSNATTIDSALNYIKSKQRSHQKKGEDLDSTSAGEEDDEERSSSSSSDGSSITTTSRGRQTVF